MNYISSRLAAALFESGSRTRGRGPFLSRQERSQRSAARMARHPPRVRASGLAVTRRRLPAPAVDAGPFALALSGARPSACAARARHTMPNTFRGLTLLLNSVGFQPRRRAEHRGQPKQGPEGSRAGCSRVRIRHKDVLYADPLRQPRCEGTRDLCGRSPPGQNGFGDFCQDKSHPGVAAPARPCARGICASCTSQGAERPAVFYIVAGGGST